MAQTAAKPWTMDEFFAWQERQEERYELVGGFPVRMMSGTRAAHDRVVINILVALASRLRGGPCRPFTGDHAMETYPGQIRRPDVGIDCGSYDPNTYRATEPRLVIEVLSPSTRDFDTFRKVPEYQAVASVDTILLIDPNLPEVTVWSRGADRGWTSTLIEDMAGGVEVPTLGLSLPLAEIYEGVTFPVGPVRYLPDGR